MDFTHILLRYGEIFLKGKNRGTFERKLVDNIKKIVEIRDVNRIRSRLIVDYFNDHKLLKNVFGLVSYSLALRVEKDVKEIKECALDILNDYFENDLNVKKKTAKKENKANKNNKEENKNNKTTSKKINKNGNNKKTILNKSKKITFKIETKRSDKTFPVKSPDLNVVVGKYVEKNNKNLEFSFKDPDITLHIEINQDAVYLFIENFSCFGGLPTGVEGKVSLLIENKASLLAGLMFMKRGCDIVPIAFKKQDISLLQKYSPRELKLEIVKDLNVETLVVGDNFENKKDYETDLLVFRPLIAFSEEEIKKKLKKFRS